MLDLGHLDPLIEPAALDRLPDDERRAVVDRANHAVLADQLELEADATPAIVFEPRRIYATVEERLKDRRVVSTEDNAAREYAYSLVTRLYYLANWNEDEKVGTPA